MSKPTIFITGVTGNVGNSTFRHLDKKNFNVRVGVHGDESKGQKYKNEGAELVCIDLNDKQCLLKAFQGVDRLLLIPPSSQDRVQLSKNALQAAKEAGVKHVVLFSVVNASKKRITFQKQFSELEEMLQNLGLQWTIAQSPWFQENVLNMKEGVYLPWKDGATTFVSTFDLGRALAHILMNPENHYGKIYALTGPQLATGNDVAKALSEGFKTEIKYYDISPQEFKKRIMEQGFKEWQADASLELMEEYAMRGYQVTEDIKKITGSAPRSIFETVRASVGVTEAY
jgi:uncharacterized protein YbjT (DUF2867 family)